MNAALVAGCDIQYSKRIVLFLFIISGDILITTKRNTTKRSATREREYMMTSVNGNIFRVTGPLTGNSPVTGEFFSHKGRWRRALVFSLICVWINGWVNNREAGDLWRYHAHYDVIVMFHVKWHTNLLKPGKAYMRRRIRLSLVPLMACPLPPLSHCLRQCWYKFICTKHFCQIG